ncbi:MAG: DUF4296 domain-containing protein [Alistipes sp.]|jgi:hypothetical protein|nr:DUF4296 domain-containing protein [Alistipes sp.]
MSFAKKIFGLAAVLALGACHNPKIIPDKELAQIFHDIYLINSYVSQNNIRIDSLNIYEPVFAEYGYTSEDVQYTIGSFAKRKSARLSNDVVQVAVDMLRRESRHYHRRIEIRDTIAMIARLKYADTVYTADQIRVRRIADTARLRIVIPDVKPGRYEVSYSYMLDSLDRNFPVRANSWFTGDEGRRFPNAAKRLERGERTRMQASLEATGDYRQLVLSLGGYGEEMTAPRLDIDSLVVIYQLPDEEAARRLARERFDLRWLDTLIKRDETTLGPPFTDSRGAVAR